MFQRLRILCHYREDSSLEMLKIAYRLAIDVSDERRSVIIQKDRTLLFLRLLIRHLMLKY